MKDLKQKHAIGNQRVKTGETSQNKKQTNKQTNKHATTTKHVRHGWIMIELRKKYNLLAVIAESCGATHSRIPCNLEI